MVARFSYARFGSILERAAADWAWTAREIVGRYAPGTHPLPPQPRGAIVGWRLISENNREVARSCTFGEDDAEAHAQAAMLVAAAGDLVLHTVTADRQRGNAWCATHHGVPVMMSARRYENRSTARAAAELCLRLLPDALLDAGPSVEPVAR